MHCIYVFANVAFLYMHTNELCTVTNEDICNYHLKWDSSVAVYIEWADLPNDYRNRYCGDN